MVKRRMSITSRRNFDRYRRRLLGTCRFRGLPELIPACTGTSRHFGSFVGARSLGKQEKDKVKFHNQVDETGQDVEQCEQ